MKNHNTVLHLTVGEPVSASMARATAAMLAVKQKKPIQPYFGVGFDDVGELIGALRENGPVSVAQLARLLKRDYKNVHNDCERLIEWMAIEKDENGLIFAPYSEIVVDMKLPDKRTA
jgi:hypothetical protein